VAGLLAGRGLRAIRVRAADRDVVWLRSVLESYEGLAALHGDGSGLLTVTATCERAAELLALLEELGREVPLQILPD
jgi:hypothetical protein